MEVETKQSVHEIDVPETKEEPPENEYEEYKEEDISEEERMDQMLSEYEEQTITRVRDEMKLLIEAIDNGYVKVIDDVEKAKSENKEQNEKLDYLEKELKRMRKREILKRVFKWTTSKLWRKPKIKKSSNTNKRILYLRHTQDQIKEEIAKKFKDSQNETTKKIKEVNNRQVITDDLLLDRLDTFERMSVGVKERIRRLEVGERPVIRSVRTPKKK